MSDGVPLGNYDAHALTQRFFGRYDDPVIKKVNSRVRAEDGVVSRFFEKERERLLKEDEEEGIKNRLTDLLKGDPDFAVISDNKYDFETLVQNIFEKAVEGYEDLEEADYIAIEEKVIAFLTGRIVGKIAKEEKETLRDAVEEYFEELLVDDLIEVELEEDRIFELADKACLEEIALHIQTQIEERTKRLVIEVVSIEAKEEELRACIEEVSQLSDDGQEILDAQEVFQSAFDSYFEEQRRIRHLISRWLKPFLTGPISPEVESELQSRLASFMNISTRDLTAFTDPEKMELASRLLKQMIDVHNRKSGQIIEVREIREKIKKFIRENGKRPLSHEEAKDLQRKLLIELEREIDRVKVLTKGQALRLVEEYSSHLIEDLVDETISGTIEGEKAFIQKRVSEFLNPYLSGEITRETEPADRKSLESQLIEQAPHFKVLGKEDVLRHAQDAYITRAVQGLKAQLAHYAYTRKDDDLSSKSPPFQTLVKALLEGLTKDFPTKEWTQEDVAALAATAIEGLKKSE